jgi:hypothetical protein
MKREDDDIQSAAFASVVVEEQAAGVQSKDLSQPQEDERAVPERPQMQTTAKDGDDTLASVQLEQCGPVGVWRLR